MSNAVFIVESQPPKFSEVFALFNIVDKYEKIILCIQNSPVVIPTASSIALWQTIIKPYKDKIIIAFGDKDFKSISKLPDEYKDYTLMTIEPDIYVHLQSLSMQSVLLPRVQGYDSVFLRTAFRQSKALEWIRQHTRIS